MDRTFECTNCNKEFERTEDSDWGGEESCPQCGTVFDFSFETNFGLYVESVTLRKQLGVERNERIRET